MVLAMASPFKHPKTGVYWFRKAVPKDPQETLGKREEKRTLKTKGPCGGPRGSREGGFGIYRGSRRGDRSAPQGRHPARGRALGDPHHARSRSREKRIRHGMSCSMPIWSKGPSRIRGGVEAGASLHHACQGNRRCSWASSGHRQSARGAGAKGRDGPAGEAQPRLAAPL
ncbi:DUF6538 domain-containing protein [Bosea sp. 2KB_26]|uniref:DUF6538 domain-containing protein n=1 Tax=Bosea sp. 2KB_26 TaxID=3237475 RepID=UPI003F926617